jgi:beta-glucosidase
MKFHGAAFTLLAALCVLPSRAAEPPAYLDPARPLEERVEALLGAMTLEEKAGFVVGTSGYGFGLLPRLGLPELFCTDGPQGVRGLKTTAFPCGIAMAASWNVPLMEKVGRALGEDTLASGDSILLGPGVNLMRTPLGGRTFEYFGEDPLLAGQIAAAYIRGVQSTGAGACVKHFTGNEQEKWRTTINVEMDDRTLHELHLPAFETAVREGGAWSLMCSYNQFRGEFVSANQFLQKDTAKTAWGWDGAIISDWGAVHDVLASARGGCDIEMGSDTRGHAKLAELVKAGKLSQADLDDLVRRTARLYLRVTKPGPPPADGLVSTPARAQLARQLAADACVLLKNTRALLPLDATRLKRVAVLGPAADFKHDNGALQQCGGSGAVFPAYEITPLEGLREYLGKGVEIRYVPGVRFPETELSLVPAGVLRADETADKPGIKAVFFKGPAWEGAPVLTRVEPAVNLNVGTRFASKSPVESGPFSVRWTGFFVPPVTGDYTFALRSNDELKLYIDDKFVTANWSTNTAKPGMAIVHLEADRRHALKLQCASVGNEAVAQLLWEAPALESSIEDAVAAARASEVAIIFAGITHAYDREAIGVGDVSADKPDLELVGPQAELIRRVAEVNSNTVVVLIGGSPVTMTTWVDKVPAILNAWYPGMEGGHAIADVLFGNAEPGGRLPVTYGKRLEDWLVHRLGSEVYPGTGNNGVTTYKEGLWVGYRDFDHNGTVPEFCFGYGLSYTTFNYANLRVAGDSVTVDITNTDKRTGSEVVQLYVGQEKPPVERPVRELKGFSKITLKPGERSTVSFKLDDRCFSYWDVQQHAWSDGDGDFNLSVGASSRDIRLHCGVERRTTMTAQGSSRSVMVSSNH